MLIILLMAGTVRGQQKPMPSVARQAVFVELLGSGLTYTVNYEFALYRDPSLAIMGRVGASYLPPSSFSGPTNLVNGITMLFGKRAEFFEAGAYYLTMINKGEARPTTYLTLLAGYRYQPRLMHGFLFRLSFTPIYTPMNFRPGVRLPFTPYAGVSIGYTFR